MLKFLAWRLLQSIPMLFGLVTLVFFLSRLLPGDAASVFITPGISPAVAEQLRSQFGLDRPLLEQYLAWLVSVGSGELGYSLVYSAKVTDVLLEVFPNSLLLGVAALILETTLAVLLVRLAVRHVGSRLDRFISNATLVAYSLPSFWIGIMLLLAFSFWLKVFPSSQMYSIGIREADDATRILDVFRHLVLPALTVAIPGSALLARYIRTGITETLRQEYVVAAIGMGLSRAKVFRQYILPNSIGPAISVFGLEMGMLLSGVLVTETLFAWPGIGRVAVMAIFARDYPMILGCTLLGGILVVIANLIADVARALIDPRVHLR